MINKIHKKRGWYFGVFTNRDIEVGVEAGYDGWRNGLLLLIFLPFIRIMAGYDFGGQCDEA